MKRVLFAIIAFAAFAGSASAIDSRGFSSEDLAACPSSPKTGDPT